MVFSLIFSIIYLIICYRLLKAANAVVHMLLVHYVYPKLGWNANLDEYKHLWTVATGATDGIGKAYVQELAERGLTKFILIGRNKKKLDGFQRFLTSKYGADVKIYVLDFSTRKLEDYDGLAAFLKDYNKEIGILLNIAGIGIGTLANYLDHGEKKAEDILLVNALAPLKVTNMVLRGMVERSKGLIVNMSSSAGYRPLTQSSTYSAAKAFVSFFGEGLAHELKGSGVHVQTLMPAAVSTNMTNNAPVDGKMVVDAKAYASEAVDCLGTDYQVPGCKAHALQMALIQFIPFQITRHLIPIFFKRKADEWGWKLD